jgi:hypothetical protein
MKRVAPATTREYVQALMYAAVAVPFIWVAVVALTLI